MTIHAGDVVFLKSGSVPMTAEGEVSPGRWRCTWMTRDGEKKSDIYAERTLATEEELDAEDERQ